MSDLESNANILEDTLKYKKLVLKIFSNAKVRVRTYKLNELEQEVTKLHSKEWAIEKFFIKTTVAGIVHVLPDPTKVNELSLELSKLAKTLNVNVSASDIAKNLNGFNNSYTLTPLIDEYVYAYTNAKNINNDGLLILKLSASFGRKVFTIISSNQQNQ